MKNSKNKSVLISIKPQYANSIVSGVKTIELRKRFPTDLTSGTRLYIYSSSPEKKIIGQCEVQTVLALPIDELWKKVSIEAMISWEEYSSYYYGKDIGFGIIVSKPLRYKRPIDLRTFSKNSVSRAPQSYQYVNL